MNFIFFNISVLLCAGKMRGYLSDVYLLLCGFFIFWAVSFVVYTSKIRDLLDFYVVQFLLGFVVLEDVS